MSRHFIYPLSTRGDFYFETRHGPGQRISPDNYWDNALAGARDAWGLSNGFRLIAPGDWVWAYFTQPVSQILGVGVAKSPVTWNTQSGRHTVEIQWDAKLTHELKRNPIPYSSYQQLVHAPAVRANDRTHKVLQSWLETNGPRAIAEARTVLFAAREVQQRLGQNEFRLRALQAYGTTCAFSGCQEPDALQAAHIVPVGSGGSHDVSNCLVLRADLHTLFDLGKIHVTADMKIAVAPEVTDSTYRRLHGKPLRPPAEGAREQLEGQLAAHRRAHGHDR